MAISIKAWVIDKINNYNYRVQINNIKLKDKKIINFIFKDWKQSGLGWNNISNEEIIMLNKQFPSEEEWLNWAKKCPLKIVEIKIRNGKEKYIQHSCKTRKKRE